MANSNHVSLSRQLPIDSPIYKIGRGIYRFRGKTLRRNYNFNPTVDGAWYAENVRNRTLTETTLKALVLYVDHVMGHKNRSKRKA